MDLGPGRTAVQLAAGEKHNCAVFEDGHLCVPLPLPLLWIGCFSLAGSHELRRWPLWGRGARQRLGVGSTSAALRRALPLTPASPARSKCWGDNDYGQLGLGDTRWRNDASELGANLPSVDLGSGWTAVEVAAGSYHTCARLQNGAEQALKCWGYNDYGQLGLGDTTSRGSLGGQMGDSLPAVQLGAGRTAVALALGGLNSCALLDNASVKCWGDTNHRGGEGGEMGDSLPAVDLGPGRIVVQLAAGFGHTCAVFEDGELYAPRPRPLPRVGCFSLA